MTKFFPFPLQRGDPALEPAISSNAKKTPTAIKNLKQDTDLAHLVTVTCSDSKFGPEIKKRLSKGQPIQLTVKNKYEAKMTFVPKNPSNEDRSRTEMVDISAYHVNNMEPVIRDYQSPRERFIRMTEYVSMQFKDENGMEICFGESVEFWNLDIDNAGPYKAKIKRESNSNSYTLDTFIGLKKYCNLDYLVAYVWQDGSKIRLSFYWNTKKSTKLPKLSNPDDLKGAAFYTDTIFRFYNHLTGMMRYQQELILRAEFAMKTRNEEITHVSDEEMHPTPNDFKMQLRDYQARSLSWMVKQEQTPFTMDECLISSADGRRCIAIDDGNEIDPKPLQKLYGGILADEVGTGKTLTMLALMKARPLDRSRIPTADYEKYEDGDNIVKATLVICPANLVNQWEFEYHKCIRNGGRIIKLTTIVQARKYTMKDIHEADMIVMSHSFLSNQNFFNEKDSLKVKYLALKYHRIVVDEFHELLDSMHHYRTGEVRATSRVYQIFNELDSYSKFGLSGTPNYHNFQNVVRTGKILGVYIPKLEGYAALFKRHYVRRSVPDLKLPPIHYEEVDVQLNPEERAIYQSIGNNSRAALLLCSHFDIQRYAEESAEAGQAFVGGNSDKLLSVNEVAVKIQAGRQAEIEKKEVELSSFKERLERMQDNENRYKAPDFARVNRSINSLTESIAELKGEHAFFENVLQALRNRSEQECNICLSEFGNDDSVALTRCGHIFCTGCIERSLQLKKVCPMCRRDIAPNSLYKVSAEEAVKPEEKQPHASVSRKSTCNGSCADPIVIDMSDDEDAVVGNSSSQENGDNEAPVDQRFYGSKITKMAGYINDVLNSDANARILLFVQFTPLSKLVSSALNALGVQNSFVFGNIFQRNNAIDKFRSNQVRVIMLSAETSVTGLQLTEATHVVLLHPFYHDGGQDDRAVAAEKQGVARAYRLGLNHELKVVRFVVKNTIEEEILSARPRLPV